MSDASNFRRISANDQRSSRRSRHSPHASVSSDSSRDSASPRYAVLKSGSINNRVMIFKDLGQKIEERVILVLGIHLWCTSRFHF